MPEIHECHESCSCTESLSSQDTWSSSQSQSILSDFIVSSQ